MTDNPMSADPAARERVRDLLRRPCDVAEYERIRGLWKAHSIAEDERDLAGLIATLTPDCVYEVLPGGRQWHGHAGARAFYAELLGAFPDIRFELQNIVIGPQGVFEEARVTGTHQGQWLGYPPTGEALEWTVLIFFPWDAELKKFAGERVHFHSVDFG